MVKCFFTSGNQYCVGQYWNNHYPMCALVFDFGHDLTHQAKTSISINVWVCPRNTNCIFNYGPGSGSYEACFLIL